MERHEHRRGPVPRRSPPGGCVPALLAVLLATACEDPAAEKTKACRDALSDARRLLSERNLERARSEQERAAGSCPATMQEDVLQVQREIAAVEQTMKELREKQDQEEKERVAKTRVDGGKPPVIGEHSRETGATGECKTYVDCLCGIADGYRYKTGVDAHRASCTDAKKVLAGKNAQEGCKTLLGELVAQGDAWKEPFELQGVSIPTACP